MNRKLALASVAILLSFTPLPAQEKTRVELMRVPQRGIQPQALTDARGDVHLLYFQGDPAGGDLFYVRTHKENGKFSAPLKVNDLAGSAVALGNMRGGQLALGKNGRAHVAWLGSFKTKLKEPPNATGMFYARLNDAGDAFEPQRNIIQEAFGLDGGGSVAVDPLIGSVVVTWLAPAPGTKGESNRCVWVARSKDEGKTFTKEARANSEMTGACSCCGMRTFADSRGNLYMLYRSAFETVNRDIHLLTEKTQMRFQNVKLHKQKTSICPLSTFFLAETANGVVAGWDNDGQVFFVRIDPTTGKTGAAIPAPGESKNRKHPVLAGNAKGETIFVWTEGIAWNRGGSLAWQVYDKAGNPTAEHGTAAGVPVWSLVAAFSRSDGTFVILY